MEQLEVKVTKIKSRWHARLIKEGKVIDEMACSLRLDIGYICRQMMRWYDKCGGMSIHANHARKRLNGSPANPVGKVWWNLLHKDDKEK